QGPPSDAFHQPHPAAHRTPSDPENPSRLGLQKTFLNGFHNSSAKIFLRFRRQQTTSCFSMPRTLTHYVLNITYIVL
ncbi:MAG TPA: hypothetical protein VNE63_17045, partial [Candidatus Acidoferrales bacterium]|nr:hypothetical protein [Candidatus Acidoferrales bacterium]